MPIPGNAEWLLWFAVEILFAIIWAASPSVNGTIFMAMTAVVTFGYLISRGIAKASRVLEQ
jgi:nicotinamide riboside transporter PnuC